MAVHNDFFTAREVVHVHTVTCAFEQQVKAGVHQTLFVHALAYTRFVEQVHGHLLQHACADTREHIVGALALDDDGVDARLEQQLAQQQARWACANNGHLGAGGAHGCLLKSVNAMPSSLRGGHVGVGLR